MSGKLDRINVAVLDHTIIDDTKERCLPVGRAFSSTARHRKTLEFRAPAKRTNALTRLPWVLALPDCRKILHTDPTKSRTEAVMLWFTCINAANIHVACFLLMQACRTLHRPQASCSGETRRVALIVPEEAYAAAPGML
jgi:hypothetical protein